MTENKNPGNDPSEEFERQRKRKVLLFAAILGCIFLVVLWFIMVYGLRCNNSGCPISNSDPMSAANRSQR